MYDYVSGNEEDAERICAYACDDGRMRYSDDCVIAGPAERESTQARKARKDDDVLCEMSADFGIGSYLTNPNFSQHAVLNPRQRCLADREVQWWSSEGQVILEEEQKRRRANKSLFRRKHSARINVDDNLVDVSAPRFFSEMDDAEEAYNALDGEEAECVVGPISIMRGRRNRGVLPPIRSGLEQNQSTAMHTPCSEPLANRHATGDTSGIERRIQMPRNYARRLYNVVFRSNPRTLGFSYEDNDTTSPSSMEQQVVENRTVTCPDGLMGLVTGSFNKDDSRNGYPSRVSTTQTSHVAFGAIAESDSDNVSESETPVENARIPSPPKRLPPPRTFRKRIGNTNSNESEGSRCSFQIGSKSQGY